MMSIVIGPKWPFYSCIWILDCWDCWAQVAVSKKLRFVTFSSQLLISPNKLPKADSMSLSYLILLILIQNKSYNINEKIIIRNNKNMRNSTQVGDIFPKMNYIFPF